MKIKFTSFIRRANRGGTGFLAIPKDKLSLFYLGGRVQVELFNKIHFFSRIVEYSHKLGVYVPKNLMKMHKLLNKKVQTQIKKIRGFYAPVASDGRVYIPYDVVKNNLLHQNDIISIKAIEDNKIIQEKYVKIYVTTRPKRKQKEFIYYIDKTFCDKTLLFRVEKLPQVPQNKKINLLVAKLLQDMHYAFIDNNSVIIFKGNKIPVIINTNLELPNLAFYSGAYFADGTKKGNSWAICASTFEQAKFYLKMHNLLVKDSKPELVISYTSIHNTDTNDLKRNLARIWKNKVGINVDKFRIRKPTGRLTARWNKYGTLVTREHRQILLDFYNALLKLLIKEILLKEDRKLAMDLICGVLEGDGCASAKNHGHITITANKKDVSVLENILEITRMKFKTTKEGENKYTLRIGALEILRNFHLIKDKIFVLYPKRRKAFFERLKTVGAIKFLIENHNPTNWVKLWLRGNNFCDENYQITTKGLEFRKNLLNYGRNLIKQTK